MDKKHYNLTEVAAKLGVTRQTLYYWIKKGWLKPKRDYRNYPVLTDFDVKKIKIWKEKLK